MKGPWRPVKSHGLSHGLPLKYDSPSNRHCFSNFPPPRPPKQNKKTNTKRATKHAKKGPRSQKARAHPLTQEVFLRGDTRARCFFFSRHAPGPRLIEASVLSWEAPLTVRAFDHLPLRALMSAPGHRFRICAVLLFFSSSFSSFFLHVKNHEKPLGVKPLCPLPGHFILPWAWLAGWALRVAHTHMRRH